MAINRILNPDGTETLGRELEFDVVREEWSEYQLRDGGRVRVRATALRILRVVDEEGRPQFTEDGQPSVLVRSEVQIVAQGD